MRMKNFYLYLLAAVSCIVTLTGCASESGVRLKTENLFCDGETGSPQTVSDYDALIFKSEGSEI